MTDKLTIDRMTAQRLKRDRVDISRITDQFIRCLIERLARDGRVTITGLGVFTVYERVATSTNRRIGKRRTANPCRTVSFRKSKRAWNSLNEQSK